MNPSGLPNSPMISNPDGPLDHRPQRGDLIGQLMIQSGISVDDDEDASLTNMKGPRRGGVGSHDGDGDGDGNGGDGDGGVFPREIKRTILGGHHDRHLLQLGVPDGCTGGGPMVDKSYTSLNPNITLPSNEETPKNQVKVKVQYMDNKVRRYVTFNKRKNSIMKKAYELTTLTGTQVMLLVAPKNRNLYTFATRKLRPIITSEAGKSLIKTCLASPDPPEGSTKDERMSSIQTKFNY